MPSELVTCREAVHGKYNMPRGLTWQVTLHVMRELLASGSRAGGLHPVSCGWAASSKGVGEHQTFRERGRTPFSGAHSTSLML